MLASEFARERTRGVCVKMLESGVTTGVVVVAAVYVWWWGQLDPFIILLTLTIIASVWYSRRRHSYWSSQGISSPPSLPFIGHLHKIVTLTNYRWELLHELYNEFYQEKCFGMYECFKPVLIIRDPDLLKNLLVKDFSHFTDRRAFGDQEGSLMNEMLANKNGEGWKILRSIMSPTFSSGKMKRMFPLVCQNVQTFISACLEEAKQNEYVNMKDKSGRFSMDNIASCAFGIECNSQSVEKSMFAENAEGFFAVTPWKALRFFLMILFPKAFNAVGLKLDSHEIMFFLRIVEETVKSRENAPKRGDFLDLMLEARGDTNDDNTSVKNVLKDKAMVAQCVMFLIAGYDTVASVTGFCTHLLAKNPKQQERLRQEMQDLVRENEGLTYEGVMEAKFLDACVMETLRIFPPGTLGERVCTKTYRVPGTEITVRPGDLVQFPIYSLHRDPQYWKDPLQFRPDRFMGENKAEIKNFTFMPFGMGPRNCLAMRFALMELKAAVASLVLEVDLQLVPGHEEIILDHSPIILRAKHGIPLIMKPRKTTVHTT
ncbi:hypothetical protein Pmani_005259 [Petrolisthes manimaculis]|uniref:Cytochrome P450 n=1 Tax=Petrolisthes manimaculis TaxID=1843537 RepID=A0AAE1QCJ4_9EUCA|nr:hypothetical protein Pmani_005259 [Petrolisthes manimaculis]